MSTDIFIVVIFLTVFMLTAIALHIVHRNMVKKEKEQHDSDNTLTETTKTGDTYAGTIKTTTNRYHQKYKIIGVKNSSKDALTNLMGLTVTLGEGYWLGPWWHGTVFVGTPSYVINTEGIRVKKI